MNVSKRFLVANAAAGTDFDLTSVGLKFMEDQLQEEMEGVVEAYVEEDPEEDLGWDGDAGYGYHTTQTQEEANHLWKQMKEEEKNR